MEKQKVNEKGMKNIWIGIMQYNGGMSWRAGGERNKDDYV